MFGRLLPRLPRRGVHKLAWPRPHSPLASLIGQASDVVAAAEAEAAKAAYARRLPPVDEATSFESYLHAVGASEETSEEVRPLSSVEQAEQIRREAAEHRVRRRRGLSGLAGDFIEDKGPLELPAGRVDPQEAAGRVVIDRSGQQPTSMWPPPSSSSSSSSSSLQQQQQQRQQQQRQQQQQQQLRPSNDPSPRPACKFSLRRPPLSPQVRHRTIPSPRRRMSRAVPSAPRARAVPSAPRRRRP